MCVCVCVCACSVCACVCACASVCTHTPCTTSVGRSQALRRATHAAAAANRSGPVPSLADYSRARKHCQRAAVDYTRAAVEGAHGQRESDRLRRKAADELVHKHPACRPHGLRASATPAAGQCHPRRGPVPSPPRASAIPAAGQCHPRRGPVPPPPRASAARACHTGRRLGRMSEGCRRGAVERPSAIPAPFDRPETSICVASTQNEFESSATRSVTNATCRARFMTRQSRIAASQCDRLAPHLRRSRARAHTRVCVRVCVCARACVCVCVCV